MDKNLRVQVLETYNRYVNAIVEADMEKNKRLSYYSLVYISENLVKMITCFLIDPIKREKIT